MALVAGHGRVRAGQRELGKRVVIEGRRIPCACVVAGLASGGEVRLCVRRIVGLVEVRQVTANAGCRQHGELAARVAGAAIQARVRAGQRKMRGRVRSMIELRAHPVVHRVALFARGRKTEGNVIDASRLSIDKVALMARVAGRRKALELPHSSALVARIAVQRGVCADQREAVEVLVDLLDRDVPALHVVTLFAIRAHLAFMNVGVAVGAELTYIGEYGLDVALGAFHALVHAAQRIFRCVVIKLGDSADGLPTTQGVAVLTRDAKASVRAAGVGRRLRLSTCVAPRENRQRD